MYAQRPQDGPVTLYAWDVEMDRSGMSGVTDDRVRAIGDVHETLIDLPADAAAHGIVRKVALDPSGRAAYVDLETVGEARRDVDSGAIVWRGR